MAVLAYSAYSKIARSSPPILKAEPEVHFCGEFDLFTPRISEFTPLGNLGFGSDRSPYGLSFSEASRYTGMVNKYCILEVGAVKLV